MEERTEIETDRQRAEIFDALGHPTRIAILKALNEGALGFAELKKKTGIESSGHLTHHLNKLDGLIKTDEYGKYCLSDQGKDALLTVQTVENASSTQSFSERSHQARRFHGKMGLKSVALLLATLLIASAAFAAVEYYQTVDLQRQVNRANGINLDAMAYYNEFGVIPSSSVNASFTPPISMYRAVQIALETNGWNKTSLNGMTVSTGLANWMMVTDPSVYNGTGTPSTEFSLSPLTNPPPNYSDVSSDGVMYRYVWEITVENASHITIPPIGFALVDASTGQILQTPMFV
jgi:DNA-binding HxlR family transcriptional regulator